MSKSPKPAPAGGEPLDFEAALAELETLVAGMESGQLSLEQSLEADTLQAFPGAEQDE